MASAPCNSGFPNIITCFIKTRESRVPPHKTDVTVSCNIIMCIQSHTSHHLCCILLFGSKSQVSPTFKERYYTKACSPGGRDCGAILGLSTTICLFFSLLLLLYIGLNPSTGNSSKVHAPTFRVLVMEPLGVEMEWRNAQGESHLWYLKETQIWLTLGWIFA